MLFICYPKCSTCQKAKKWLDDNNIVYEERHIVNDNPSYDELKKWSLLANISLNKLFNTSGILYREMNLKEKLSSMSDDEKLKLLASNGMLVKRPLLILDNNVLVGFKKAIWNSVINE